MLIVSLPFPTKKPEKSGRKEKTTDHLFTQAEKAGRTEEVEIIKRISPVAWRHVNFLGRFVFQHQQNPLDIDEMIKTLEQEIKWQKQEPDDETLT